MIGTLKTAGDPMPPAGPDSAADPGPASAGAGIPGWWGGLLAVALFSGTVNLLILAGPIFMLQVYDRVLTSRSVETLGALFLLVGFLYLLMGVLDLVRSRVMGRLAARLQTRLAAPVFDASLRDCASGPDGRPDPESGVRDLDAVGRTLAAPVTLAVFDLPWVPLFLGAIFLFHPMLGLLASLGGLILALATIATRLLTAGPLQKSNRAAAQAGRLADLYRDQAEVVGALGMRGVTFARWRSLRSQAEGHAVRGADRSAVMTAFSRAFRLFLQTALLAAGAWLVLRDQLTPGAMIASSVMMGRALAPIDQLVGGWPLIQSALDGWSRLSRLLTRHPVRPPITALPRPDARIEVQGLAIAPPGAPGPVLRGVGLQLGPGQALGVIGSSGAGKTSLARALIGAWTPLTGTVRLGGATLDQYPPDVLGALVGYLPQQVTLFDGTIAENIARLAVRPDPQRVIEAARAADAHQMILALPQGYDTRISQIGGRLSGGQVQRIGLARALYPDPVLLVLDEPNSNLDNSGSEALNLAIKRQKAKGGAVIIMAHRPAAIHECDLLMVLERGQRRAFGPRDKVLRQMVQNSGQITQAQVVGFNGGMT